tara:strand:+ start:5732 stop:6091 length:360 start_codon:yes stop_codon:yes gene_type:complete
MKGESVILTREQALCVARAFDESAGRHNIRLLIGAVMNTHVHLVTECDTPVGSEQLRLFKGGSSRELTRIFGSPLGRWWTKSGSVKPKFDDAEKRVAVDYVGKHLAIAWCGEMQPGCAD